MSYGKPVFDYTLPFPLDEYGQIQSWPDHHSSRSIMIPRTIAPAELSRKPETYGSERGYRIEQQFGVGSRNNSHTAYHGYPNAVPAQMYRQARRSDERVPDQQYSEGPIVTIEVRSQRPRSQRYYCEFKECIDPNTGIPRSVGRKADLRRHVLSVHGKPEIDCKFSKCWRQGEDGFCRRDHYREHLRGYHNLELPKEDKKKSP